MKPGETYTSGSADKPAVVVILTVDEITVRFITIGWLVGPKGEPYRMDVNKEGGIILCSLKRDMFEATHTRW